MEFYSSWICRQIEKMHKSLILQDNHEGHRSCGRCGHVRQGDVSLPKLNESKAQRQ